MIFIFLAAVFVFSLMLFVLSRYGFMYMPFFGFMATVKALSAIPLLLLFATIVLLVLIEIISRQYTIAFKRPLVVTLLSITSFAAVVSYIISQTGIHEYIHSYAKLHRLDMMSRAYDRPIPFKPRGDMTVIRGEVVATTSTSTSVRLFDGVVLIAYASTSFNNTFVQPEVGRDIVLFGTFLGDRFEIIDIREAPQMPFGGRVDGRNKMHNDMRNSLNPSIMPIRDGMNMTK
jgi:hypothetical protein